MSDGVIRTNVAGNFLTTIFSMAYFTSHLGQPTFYKWKEQTAIMPL